MAEENTEELFEDGSVQEDALEQGVEGEADVVETEEEALEESDSGLEQDSSSDEVEEISDEDLDVVADAAIDALQGILSYFDADGAEINEYEGDERELILDIVGGDLGILIGRHGRTLDALQVLVSAIARNKVGFRYPVTVDVESYKHRQRQKIESLAYSAASRAYKQNREIKLRPMNPYERRLVHMALRDDDRVETYSVGTEPERYVVVQPL